MKVRFGPSLYFASDKVIFDSLVQHQVGMDLIRELFAERGILVSSHTPKDELAQYFSRLTADYYDHQNIASKLGRVARRDRVTASEIEGKVDDSHIREALENLREKLGHYGQTVEISVENGVTSALIHYEHIDYRRPELKQVEPRDALIEFSRESDGKIVLRSPQNNEIDPIVDSLITDLNQIAGGTLSQTRVNMESIADPTLRTRFFDTLIKGLDGYKFVTVTEAYCYKPRFTEEANDDAEEEDDNEELEKSPYVERVGLRGDGVNRSFLAKDLLDKGYYIVKVVWRVRPAARIDSDIFEIEAQFSDPQRFVGFSYRVRGVHMVEDGKLTKKRRSAKNEENDDLFRKIESSAKKALISLT